MFRICFKNFGSERASWTRQASSIDEAYRLIMSKTKLRGMSDYERHGFWFGDSSNYIEVASGESSVDITRKKINSSYTWCVKDEASMFPFVGDDLSLLLKSVFGKNL